MKPLFKNYNYSFDKNETKILINFCKQAINQLSGDSKYFSEIKAYTSIMEKINSDSSNVKLTKDEVRRLALQLKENVKFIKEKAQKSWFIKKWLYNSLSNQYSFLINKHFTDIK